MILIQTDDGSHTMKHACGDHYHSLHGSIQESQHIYIDHGVQAYINKHQGIQSLRILEVGFGTGLNAYLTARQLLIHVEYIGVEPDPVTDWDQLNYPLCLNDASSLFSDIHFCEWGKAQLVTDKMVLNKVKSCFEDIQNQLVDVIYYDAFSPKTMPSCWDYASLEKAVNCLKDGGLLVTYCCNGMVKRCLKELGCDIQLLPGPIGKRHMLQAFK